MKRIETEYRTFQDLQVIDEFTGIISTENIRAVVNHLTNKELASVTEEVKEEDEEISFKMYGRWITPKESTNVFLTIGEIEKDLDGMSPVEVKDKIEYIMSRTFALSLMLVFFRKMDLKKFIRSFKQREIFIFNRFGIHTFCRDESSRAPFQSVVLQSPGKKEILERILSAKIKWENLKDKLVQKSLSSSR